MMSSQIDGMLDVLAQSPIRRDHQKYEGAFLPEEGKVLTEVREIIEHAKAETGKPVNAVAQKGISRDDTWGISIAAIFGLSALSAVVAPPFIIGSALLGGLYLFKNQDNNHGDLDEQIYKMCKEMREQVKENHMNAFLESLESESNRFCEQLHGIFMHQLLGEELSVQKYQILSSEIDNYILSVEKLSINQ